MPYRNNDTAQALMQVQARPWVSRPLFVKFTQWLQVNLIINDLHNRVGMRDCIRLADLGYVAHNLTAALGDSGQYIISYRIQSALLASCPGWKECWQQTQPRLRKEIMDYWRELITAAETIKEFDSYGPPSQ